MNTVLAVLIVTQRVKFSEFYYRQIPFSCNVSSRFWILKCKALLTDGNVKSKCYRAVCSLGVWKMPMRCNETMSPRNTQINQPNLKPASQ